MNLLDFIHSNQALTNSDELIFFGGSFNPWHDGHNECVNRALKHAPVIIVPDNNPFKNYDDQMNRSPSINKIDQIVDNKTSFLFLGFSEFKKSNPTNSWIEPLRKKLDSKLSLLMGFDSFISILSWFDANSLIRNLDGLYVLSRLESSIESEEHAKKLMLINNELKITFLGHHEYEGLSSTKIRSKHL